MIFFNHNFPYRFKKNYKKLTAAIKSNILHQEKYLDRECGYIKIITNRLKESFIIADFYNRDNRKDVIKVTIAYWDKRVHNFLISQ